jgi:hypothetical protein
LTVLPIIFEPVSTFTIIVSINAFERDKEPPEPIPNCILLEIKFDKLPFIICAFEHVRLLAIIFDSTASVQSILLARTFDNELDIANKLLALRLLNVPVTALILLAVILEKVGKMAIRLLNVPFNAVMLLV